jgi:hypothetical protein
MVEPVNLNDFREVPAKPRPLETKRGGGDSSGMGPSWEQTVETRLGELRTDVRDLTKKVDSHFLWIIGALAAGFLTLAGLIGKSASWW